MDSNKTLGFSFTTHINFQWRFLLLQHLQCIWYCYMETNVNCETNNQEFCYYSLTSKYFIKNQRQPPQSIVFVLCVYRIIALVTISFSCNFSHDYFYFFATAVNMVTSSICMSLTKKYVTKTLPWRISHFISFNYMLIFC